MNFFLFLADPSYFPDYLYIEVLIFILKVNSIKIWKVNHYHKKYYNIHPFWKFLKFLIFLCFCKMVVAPLENKPCINIHARQIWHTFKGQLHEKLKYAECIKKQTVKRCESVPLERPTCPSCWGQRGLSSPQIAQTPSVCYLLTDRCLNEYIYVYTNTQSRMLTILIRF